MHVTKGQLISKWFFGVVDFLQKMNKNKSTWGIIVVKSNSFVHFLEEIDDPKKPFRSQLTFNNFDQFLILSPFPIADVFMDGPYGHLSEATDTVRSTSVQTRPAREQAT